MLRGCGHGGWLPPLSPPLQVRHGDSCIASEAARPARRCEPLTRYVGGGGALPGGARVLPLTLSLSLSLSLSVARYVDAVAPYLAEHGVRTVFLATDSEEVGEI